MSPGHMKNHRKKSFVFIVNPIAGNRKYKDIEKKILSYFTATDIEPLICLSEYAGHAEILCRQLVEQPVPPATIVAVGGDGTVNDLANGIGLSRVPLGIIPHGSGNGFARHLGIPMNVERALEVLRQGFSVSVDMVRIGEKYSLNVSGVGFDALVAWKFQHSKARGLSSYARIALGEFFRYQPETYVVSADGKKSRYKAFLISLANSSQFGNNFLISPEASVCDGYLDLCILHPFSRWTILGFLVKLLCKKIDSSPYLEIIKAKKVCIQQPGEIWHLDGEAMSGGSELQVEVVERALSVIIPESRQNHI
ncbi:MAG: YegS/Rv2252/BmrU family lipid kinase [Xanthomonadaceae bacterium]|nr:YegS/Rv2252/BmrU family lipid kinase [Xanthomonadaceae bacterium]